MSTRLPTSTLEALRLKGTRLVTDTRLLQSGDLFCALMGSDGRHGLDFLSDREGALLGGIVIDRALSEEERKRWGAIPVVVDVELHASAPRLAEWATWCYGNPSASLCLIGVTGTNGKTSVTHYIAQLIEQWTGEPCGVLGTLGGGRLGQLQSVGHTTPPLCHVYQLLSEWVESGWRYGVLEVSSHALDQGRLWGLQFHTVVFTNLSRDHLDYHGSMEAYFEAKKKLFFDYDVRHRVIDTEQDAGLRLYHLLKRQSVAPLSTIDERVVQELHLEGVYPQNLVGSFNYRNWLAAARVGQILFGPAFSGEKAIRILEQIQPVSGRMESVAPRVLVDYAHTPDALEQVLSTVRDRLGALGKLWLVFGCGGERDRGKRALMGAVAVAGADWVVLTNDNPRSEDPAAIVEAILEGIPSEARPRTRVELDRQRAIEWALRHRADEDWVVIAGKGHEDYQLVQGKTFHFSDKAMALAYLNGPSE